MTRVAIYARYSTPLQKVVSIEDQFRICHEYAERRGWQVVKTYSDYEQSGESLFRPSVQEMLEDAYQGKYDVLLAESMDRVSRDQEGSAAVFKRMTFNDIEIHTLAKGRALTALDVGMESIINQHQIEEGKRKVRRGMRGRVENGKSAGGLPYGYRVPKKFDENGDR